MYDLEKKAITDPEIKKNKKYKEARRLLERSMTSEFPHRIYGVDATERIMQNPKKYGKQADKLKNLASQQHDEIVANMARDLLFQAILTGVLMA